MTFRIRPAVDGDADRLVEIELDAGRVFVDVGMPEVAAHEPDEAELRVAIAAGRVWVLEADEMDAVAEAGPVAEADAVGTVVAGYVCAEVVDGNAHVAQVSVATAYAGRRLGRELIEHVEQWGRRLGCPATTLTTFRDVPWNAPYYARLGYEILPAERVGPELRRLIEHEASMPGIDGSRRCAMIRE